MKSVILEVKILDDAGHVESTCVSMADESDTWDQEHKIKDIFDSAKDCALRSCGISLEGI